MPILNFFNKTFAVYNIKGISIEPTYWQAVAILILLFLLVFTLARLRFLYIHWSLGKSNLSFLFYGFLLSLILEGFLILSGRTVLTELLGWKSAPKPIGTALDMGREKLINVLGEENSVSLTNASEKGTYSSVVSDYGELTLEEKSKVKNFICKP